MKNMSAFEDVKSLWQTKCYFQTPFEHVFKPRIYKIWQNSEVDKQPVKEF